MDPARIADLRRRLQADPTSIAFAQLAEEHRRARQFDAAVAVCREGLQRHPGYLSARVTLGRALAELGQLPGAEHEFELVLRSAPDNLAALRGLAEIHEAQGQLSKALAYYRRALSMARYDPDLDETVRAIAQELHTPPPAEGEGLSFAETQQELIDAAARVPASTPPPTRVDFDRVLESLGVAPDAPAPPQVEAWLGGPTGPIEDDTPAQDVISAPRQEVSAPDGASADDLLARLEADLRQLEQRPVPPRGRPVDAIAIAELERWLAAVVVRREQLARAKALALRTL